MASATSPALFLGKCITSTMRKTVCVSVPRFVLDKHLLAHYKERTEYDVLDRNEECQPGDWVLIKELPERISLRVAHKVERIVFKSGNIIDPLTGEKCIFTEFVKDVDQESEIFGISPPYKSVELPEEVPKLTEK
uniref:Putative mitochondrial/ ribosomal s17-like protein n=2 Tax=Ornithodoros turicata TaxID=34597 RepID=A0A2R5LFU4_9ACAR